MMFHVVGIFVSVEIHPVFFCKRIFYPVSYEEKGKMKVFFFMMPCSCIGTQSVCFKSKSDRDLGSAKMKFPIQFPVEGTDLRRQYCRFFL